MTLYPSGSLIANRYEVVQGPHEKSSLAGGMGLVYLCVDHEEKDFPVALKTFRPELLPDHSARDRFLRECATWIDLGDHPHIVRAYDIIYISEGLEVFIVLELVAPDEGKENASLRELLKQCGTLPIEQSLVFGLHIARGMKHATKKIPNLVHRDLKPENILIGQDKLARVTDFGLAKAIGDASSKLKVMQRNIEEMELRRTQITNGIVGTPLYMAPEQWTNAEIDVRSDIYAFGCILYEMITGEFAITGRSINELKKAHLSGKVNLEKITKGINTDVITIIRKCTNILQDSRFQFWIEVEAALTKAYHTISSNYAPDEIKVTISAQAARIKTGWSYNTIGGSYLDIGKYKTAVSYFQRVLDIGIAEQERRMEASALGNLGLAYFQLGESHKALDYLEKKIAIAREIGDRKREGHALSIMGEIYRKIGELTKSLEYHEQHLKIAREIGDPDGEWEALSHLGLDYYSLGDARRAVYYYLLCLAPLQKFGLKKRQGQMLGNLGEAYRQMSEFDKAIKCYEQQLDIGRQIADRQMEEYALGNLGSAYGEMGKFSKAIEYTKEYQAIAEKIGDRMAIGNALTNLANNYCQLGKVYEAIELFEKSLKIKREICDQQGEASTLCNLGSAYAMLGKIAKAIEYFSKHLEIVRAIKDRHGECIALGNLGNAYRIAGDLKRAAEYLEKSLTIAKETNDKMQIAQTSGNLAMLLAQQNRLPEALNYAQYAVQMFTNAGHIQHAQQAQNLIKQIRMLMAYSHF